jgi:hypothetical protein
MAEYGEGNDAGWIAWKHGINVERVYEVVHRIVGKTHRRPPAPTSS